MGSCTHEFYEFRPFLEEVTALRLGALRRSTGLYVCVCLQKCEPLSQRREVAYIECARTPAPVRYTEFNAHKGKALLVTSTVNVINAHNAMV